MSGTYKQFTGNAAATTLTTAISGSPTTFATAAYAGFPTGAGGVPFVVCVDRNTASEEKILCSSQSAGVFTIQTRGFDGSAQTNHASGATVEHVIDADTMNDLEQHVHVTSRDDHTQYLKVDGSRNGTGTQTLAGLSVTGSATIGSGATVSAGGLTVSAGGAAVTGNSTFANNVAITGTASVTGNTTLSGTLASGAITSSGEVKGTDFAPTGLTGATAATRYVGATVSGAPLSGTFSPGDFVIDQSGTVWIYTSSNTWSSPASAVQAVSGSLSGGSPVSPFKIQAGTGSGTTNSSGELTVNFPAAFANGLVSVVASNYAGGPTNAEVSVINGSKTSFTLGFEANGSAYTFSTANFTWIAVGW